MFPIRRLCSQRVLQQASRLLALPSPIRTLSTTHICALKRVNVVEEGDKIVIEGEYITSPNEKYLIKFDSTDGSSCVCSLCKLGLHIKHTDVLILRQFTNSKGKIIPRKVTGLCKIQHNRMKYLLVMAEKAGLIDVYTKAGTKRELVGWEAFNKYYDEGVIEEFVHYKTKRNRA